MPLRAPLTFLSSRGRVLQATETTLQTICALDTMVSSLPFLGEPPSSSASSSSSDNSFPPTYTPPSPSFLLPLSQFPPPRPNTCQNPYYPGPLGSSCSPAPHDFLSALGSLLPLGLPTAGPFLDPLTSPAQANVPKQPPEQ